MTTELESMAVEMPVVEGHPNRVAFRGVLTVVDVPSNRAPSGSRGKRVLLTRKAAERGLPSLIGMAVDYAPSYDKHDQKRKVGVITSADVVGSNLEVGGFLYAKDFPEVVKEIGRLGRSSGIQRGGLQASGSGRGEGATLRAKLMAAVEDIRAMIQSARAKAEQPARTAVLRAESPGAGRATGSGPGKRGLGMSFEVTNVNVLNPDAGILKLIDVTFTGAAILRKDKAAYEDTWIELSG